MHTFGSRLRLVSLLLVILLWVMSALPLGASTGSTSLPARQSLNSGKSTSGPMPRQTAEIIIIDFYTALGDAGVELRWETASEWNIAGFNLYRSDDQNHIYVQRNTTLIPCQFPGSPQGAEYVWPDEDAAPGVTYSYLLATVDAEGQMVYFGPSTITPPGMSRVFLPAVSKQH